jgi:hypothetical protein
MKIANHESTLVPGNRRLTINQCCGAEKVAKSGYKWLKMGPNNKNKDTTINRCVTTNT